MIMCHILLFGKIEMKMKKKTMQSVKGKSDVKNIISLGLTSFFNDTASEMIYPLLPAFLAIQLGAGPAGLGLVEGVAETTSSVLKYYSGWLSDRWKKRKPIFVFGYLFSNIVRPLTGIVTSWLHVFLLRFADRVGKGLRTAPRDAILADSATIKHRALAFSFHRAMDHSGALVGPIIAWFLMAKFGMGYREVFLWSAVPGIFVILTVIFLVRERISAVDAKKVVDSKKYEAPSKKSDMATGIFSKNGLQSVKVMKLHKSFYHYLFIIIIFTLGNSSDAFLLLLAQNKGIGLAMLPILWGVLHISKMTFSFLGGWLGDRWSKRGIITAGWLVYGMVYLGFAFSSSASQIWALFIIYGIYFGFTEGSEKAMVADFVAAKHYGRAYGLYNLAVGIGALPASLIFGFLWQVFGHKTAFIAGAALSIFAALLLNIIRMKRENDS
jgi:MFS family permease